MLTLTRPFRVPAPGDDPAFDEFVDVQLAEHDDFLQEERQQMWEYLSNVCEEAWEVQEGTKDWWKERVAQLRTDFWEEWTGSGLNAAEAREQAEPESASVRELLAERDGRIARLKRKIRRLRRRQEANKANLSRKEQELQIERELVETVREQKRCRSCGEPMFGR